MTWLRGLFSAGCVTNIPAKGRALLSPASGLRSPGTASSPASGALRARQLQHASELLHGSAAPASLWGQYLKNSPHSSKVKTSPSPKQSHWDRLRCAKCPPVPCPPRPPLLHRVSLQKPALTQHLHDQNTQENENRSKTQILDFSPGVSSSCFHESTRMAVYYLIVNYTSLLYFR